jgi:hypothetical protein
MTPSAVALPPASRISTASAIGKAENATTVTVVEIRRFLYPTNESKAPGSKYFRNMGPYFLLLVD